VHCSKKGKSSNTAYLIELKPKQFLETEEMSIRKNVAENYLANKNVDWKFKILTENDIQLSTYKTQILEKVIEQNNSAIAGGVEFTNHETFNSDKHLTIAAGVINDPWFIDTTDSNPKIYNTVPSGEDGHWNVSCIANSFDDLATIMRNIQELEKEMQHSPTREILDLYFAQIRISVGDADMEYWELWYAEGEWWVEYGYPDT
jgi:hypothetical protein